MTTIKEKIDRGVAILTGKHKRYAEGKYWKKELDRVKRESHGIGMSYREGLICELERHHKAKYLHDLMLNQDSFLHVRTTKILDIGSGPVPGASAFRHCEVYCLDPLWDTYLEVGYPIDIYEDRIRFVHAPAEKIPYPNDFFDAVISVNAIDHVDDLHATAKEIGRVLKPEGKVRMHVHYHLPTVAEPININGDYFKQAFKHIPNFKPISASREKYGHVLTTPNEKYVVWSNF